ncbi:peptidase inhibitor family I36 protein [Kutzneria sp. CA-103260]|uniref:peptidase inhibitor family I36 protein n=1 Tax=Kutzneria sp. CA-103260 TaxID=2802641 RepID=UPI001BAC6932|nr:peptidase inhibitor family I36 protein [Kutzneria sp. CA-103260]QUQ64128.1 Peptidase inhibitor family I36 [Kutzneria sp. CA-103260]
MNGVFRGMAVIIPGVLAAGLALAGVSSAVTANSLRQPPGVCPDNAVCAYSEEELFGEMSSTKVTDPDLTDEPEHEVFYTRVESVYNNTDCTVTLYEKVRFRGARYVLPPGERVLNLRTAAPSLKHHIYSEKIDC